MGLCCLQVRELWAQQRLENGSPGGLRGGDPGSTPETRPLHPTCTSPRPPARVSLGAPRARPPALTAGSAPAGARICARVCDDL